MSPELIPVGTAAAMFTKDGVVTCYGYARLFFQRAAPRLVEYMATLPVPAPPMAFIPALARFQRTTQDTHVWTHVAHGRRRLIRCTAVEWIRPHAAV